MGFGRQIWTGEAFCAFDIPDLHMFVLDEAFLMSHHFVTWTFFRIDCRLMKIRDTMDIIYANSRVQWRGLQYTASREKLVT